MNSQEIKYRIYPSLLDKFQSYLDAEAEYEGPFNKNANTGEYTLTMEEIEEKLKQSLLDSINRVPFHSLAADNGTVFNELVDCLHRCRDTFRTDIEFKTFREYGVIAARFRQQGLEDEVFLYDLQSMKSAADFFRGSCSQLFVEGTMDTAYGKVQLYGFIDELKRDIVYDLKTTTSYSFGKFENHWQRYVYPYCLINSEKMKEIIGFEYSIVKWRSRTEWKLKLPQGDPLYEWLAPKPTYFVDNDEVPEGTEGAVAVYPKELKPKVLSYDYYQEFYDYDHKEATSKLRYILESFIEFLEANRDMITDTKVFNERS